MASINTDSTSAVIPAEISETIDTLNQQVESLKRELSQAQSVWQQTLTEEKTRFEQLLERKEMASQEQEAQWARQSQAYEERLAQAIGEFEARVAQTEQNAAKALAELDDNWQHDKLGWSAGAQSNWPAQREAMEAKTKALEAKLTRLEQEMAAPGSSYSGLIEFQSSAPVVQDAEVNPEKQLQQCVLALETQIGMLYELVSQNSSPEGGSRGFANS